MELCIFWEIAFRGQREDDPTVYHPQSQSWHRNCGFGEGFYTEVEEVSLAFPWVGVSWCRYTVATIPTEPQVSSGMQVHMWAVHKRDSQVYTREDIETRTSRGSGLATKHMKTSANPLMCPWPSVLQSCSRSWPSLSLVTHQMRHIHGQLWGDLSSPLKEVSWSQDVGS